MEHINEFDYAINELNKVKDLDMTDPNIQEMLKNEIEDMAANGELTGEK